MLVSALELRPYQAEAIAAIASARARGVRRVLVVLPTGTGKTVILAQLPEALSLERRLLVLAHREELLDQAAAKIQAANPAMRVEIEQADRRAGPAARVVVASVQTIGREGSARLAALAPADFEAVVVDEAHHAAATSYRRVLEHFGAFAPAGAFVLGVTATPERGDGTGLEGIFEEIVYERGLPEMIEAGFLSPLKAWRVGTSCDLAGVSSRCGDFAEGELAKAVNVASRNELAVGAYQAHAQGRRAIAFTVDVAHARALAERFNAHRIAAAAVWGDMPADDRRATLRAFAAGELHVVTNCGVLVEGFDQPEVAAIIMARPTRSPLLYRQCVGRGTRLADGKTDCVIIDLADATRHELVGAASLYGLPAGVPLKGRDLREVADDVARAAAQAPVAEGPVSAEEARARSERVDLFALLAPDPAILAISHFAWVKITETRYQLGLGEETLEARRDLLGAWRVTIRRAGQEPLGGREAFASLREAVRAADRFIVERRPEARALVDRRAKWRDAPATEKQLARLARFRIYRKDLTKGEAKALLDRLFSRRRGGRDRPARERGA